MRLRCLLVTLLILAPLSAPINAAAPGEAAEALAPEDIGLIARVHFATHTTDFDRARAFYRALGYTEGVTGFPLTNTHQMARSLGMFDLCQYELAKGEVMSLPDSPNPASIDLLQFKTPFNDDPPYDRPNHLGMAYAEFATTDFDGDVAGLKQLGARFLSEPYTGTSRYVFFKDPDGVMYKLVPGQSGSAGDVETGDVEKSGIHIFDMPLVAINVTDLDASLAFYGKLGYQPLTEPVLVKGSAEEGAAHGLDGPFELRTVDVAIRRGDQHKLRLTQWMAPFDPDPPYPPPINHIGINRVAVLVADLDRAVAILKEQGVPFLSEVASCCSGTGEDRTGIVHVIDPDGVFVELVGGIEPRPLPAQPEGCPALEIKYPPSGGDYQSDRLLPGSD